MFLAQLSDSTWALIIGQSVIGLGMVLKFCYDVNKRIQDRADKKLELEEARKARADIRKEIQGAKSVAAMGVRKADAAYHAANNINEKIAKATEIGVEILKEAPQKVEAVNDESIPVQTKPAEETTIKDDSVSG